MTILKDNAYKILADDTDPDTVSKIVDRKKEQEKLENIVFGPLRNGEMGVSTTYIFGGSGTGKTYTVRVLKSEVEEETPLNLETVYINGRKFSTYHQFLSKLLDELEHRFPLTTDSGDVIEKVPKSGWSTSRLYNTLQKLLEEQDFPLLVVLDEIDKLELDDSGQVISMFYDMASGYEGEYDVQLISISNDPMMLEKLGNGSGDIDRRIGNKIHFPSYNAQQLTEILETFADICLEEDTYEKHDIAKIASEAAATSGSASEAKRLLYHVAERSQGDSLNRELVGEAQEKVEKQMIKEEVHTKPLHQVIALQAVAEAQIDYKDAKIKKSRIKADQHAPTTDKIQEEYSELCEEYEVDEKSRRSLVRFLNNLERDDLISSNLEGLGRGKGVSKIHAPNYDSHTLIELCRESMEEDVMAVVG